MKIQIYWLRLILFFPILLVGTYVGIYLAITKTEWGIKHTGPFSRYGNCRDFVFAPLSAIEWKYIEAPNLMRELVGVWKNDDGVMTILENGKYSLRIFDFAHEDYIVLNRYGVRSGSGQLEHKGIRYSIVFWPMPDHLEYGTPKLWVRFKPEGHKSPKVSTMDKIVEQAAPRNR